MRLSLVLAAVQAALVLAHGSGYCKDNKCLKLVKGRRGKDYDVLVGDCKKVLQQVVNKPLLTKYATTTITSTKTAYKYFRREANPEPKQAAPPQPQVPSYCKGSCSFSEFVDACKCLGVKPTISTTYLRTTTKTSTKTHHTTVYANPCKTDGEKLCPDRKCRNLLSDSKNCGKCGNQCAKGLVCSGGKCTCPTAGDVQCKGKCSNLFTDAQNCGKCGKCCDKGLVCKGGSCACPVEGETACGKGKCFNLLTDAKNCGKCGKSCKDGEYCKAGTCKPICNFTECPNDICADLQTSNANCGECGNVCPQYSTCTGSECQCESPRTMCNGQCADFSSDNSNCGACGTICPVGTHCSADGCVCDDPSLTLCNGQCVNTQTDIANCGSCGRTANPVAYTCVAGLLTPTGQCDNLSKCGVGFPLCQGGNCFCLHKIEGGGLCIPNQGCGTECTSSSQCPEGRVCIIDTCCTVSAGSGVCLLNTATCSVPFRKRSIFEKRYWTEATITSRPFWIPDPEPMQPVPAEDIPVEKPTTEEPSAETPATEEPSAEEPAAEEPAVEEPVEEKSAIEKPAVEKPVVEKPAVEEPVVEEVPAEKPAVEEPVEEKPVEEKPVVEEPVIEKPAAEEPIAEKPAPAEPAPVEAAPAPAQD